MHGEFNRKPKISAFFPLNIIISTIEANDFDHLLLAVESKNANQTKAIEVATGAGNVIFTYLRFLVLEFPSVISDQY